MQASQITLSVDHDNDDANPISEDFDRHDKIGDKSIYVGPGNSLISRDELSFFRTRPKRNGNFLGVAKSAAKFTLDIEVEGVDSSTTLTAPLIINVSLSVPVGATDAEVLKARQRMVSLLDDDTVMDALNLQMEI